MLFVRTDTIELNQNSSAEQSRRILQRKHLHLSTKDNGAKPMKHDAHLNQLIDQWAADRPARRLEADRVRCQTEDFQLSRSKPAKPAPQTPLTNNRTKQAELKACVNATGGQLLGYTKPPVRNPERY